MLKCLELTVVVLVGCICTIVVSLMTCGFSYAAFMTFQVGGFAQGEEIAFCAGIALALGIVALILADATADVFGELLRRISN